MNISVLIPILSYPLTQSALANVNAQETIYTIEPVLLNNFLDPENPVYSVFNARNLGVLDSISEWVTFFAPEDVWEPNHVQTIADTIANHLACVAVLIGAKMCPVPRNNGHLLKYLENGEALPTGCIVVKREVFLQLGGFELDVRHSASWGFILKLVKLYGERVVTVNAGTWEYTYNRSSVSNSMIPNKHLIHKERLLQLEKYNGLTSL